MRKLNKRMAAVAITLASTAALTFGASLPSFAASRPVSVPSDLGNLPAHAVLLGHTKGVQPMTIVIALKPSQNLPSYVHQLDSLPPSQRHYLTPSQFQAEFGSPAATSLAHYLSGKGLKTTVMGGGLVVTATGTETAVSHAFGVGFSNFRANIKGFGNRTFYRANQGPTLPAQFAPFVTSVSGMSDSPVVHPTLVRASGPGVGSSQTQYPDSGGTPMDYLPVDIHAAYNVNAVYQDGYTGSNQTVAIMTLASFNPADTRYFWNNTALPTTPNLHVIHVNWPGNQPNTSGYQESVLDSSESGAMAPGATINEYVGYTPSFADMLQTFQAIVSANTASVISSSWGAAEDQVPSDYMNALNDVFMQAAAQGQTILQASGDTAAYADTSSSSPTVLFPASSPYVTATGGTSLYLVNDSRTAETAWTYNPVLGWGSGGGYSSVYKEPAWQLNAAISDAPRMRGVPDVALNADPTTGYQIYYGGTWNNGYGGTSFAAPEWAGFSALMDQALGTRMGNENTLLYSLALTSAYPNAMYDITQGNNGAYSAGTGWDPVTGWGTPNMAGMLTAIQGPLPIYESIRAAQSTLRPGHSTTISVSVTDAKGQGEPNQQIQLTSNSLTATVSNGGYATTNGSGVATFTVSDSTSQSVIFTAADNSAANITPADVTVSW